MVTDSPPDQRTPNSLSICSFSLIPYATPSAWCTVSHGRSPNVNMYTPASGRVKPYPNIVLRWMENRLVFRRILPLTPRPGSGYNSPSSRNPVRAASRRRSVRMKTAASKKLFRQAQRLIPGGVNSPVRAFRSVGWTPLFVAKAAGATVTDADGNTFLDYVSSWGPMILGHAHPKIVSAIRKAAGRGTSYGAPTAGEVALAGFIRKAFPSIEKVRLASSGTEAAMSAVRLARGYTGRDKIVKFEGCYHGHADPMLVKAGSGALTFGQPDSPGVPRDTAKDTLTAAFNDIASVRRLFDRNRGEIAAVIVEPIPGNMGVVLPAPGFLDELREITRRAGALLIFDEVISGFRVAFGGAQGLFGIGPDLTVLGKIIGGGLPVGAFGGKRDVMAALSPEGPVYQAGTLSGNPLAVAAGIAALTELSK